MKIEVQTFDFDDIGQEFHLVQNNELNSVWKQTKLTKSFTHQANKLIYHFMDIMPPLGTPTSSSLPGQVTLWCIAINMLRWCGPGCQPVLKLACNIVPSQLADVPASCKVNSDTLAQYVQLYSKP